MQIIRLHHVQITIPMGAELEAKQFYCDLLGLPEILKPESLIARGGFWLQLADQQVHVGVEPKQSATKAHLAYQVDDLAAWRECMSERGFSIVEGEPIQGYIRFETRDPFGNRLEFIQPVE